MVSSAEDAVEIRICLGMQTHSLEMFVTSTQSGVHYTIAAILFSAVNRYRLESSGPNLSLRYVDAI